MFSFLRIFADESLNVPKISANDILSNGLNIAFWGIGILAVVMIIASAFQIITASGDPEKAKKGQRMLLWSMIGLVIAVLSGVITSLVINTVGD